MNLSGEPTGSTVPVNNPEMEGINLPGTSSSLTFACEFPGCTKSFATIRGRGVHYSKAHKDWHDARAHTQHSKAPWSEEEERLMARNEAKLVKKGERFINQALDKQIPHRSLEAIKGKRKLARYKAYVAQYLEEEGQIPLSPHREQVTAPENQPQDALGESIKDVNSLRDVKVTNIEALRRICRNLYTWNIDRLRQETTLFLKDILSIASNKPKQHSPQTPERIITPSKRLQRRIEYAKTQKLWRKNPTICLRTILKDIKASNPPPVDLLWDYWRNVMTRHTHAKPKLPPNRSTHELILNPITVDEIRKAIPANNTSPGPDGLTVANLKKMPLIILEKVFNLLLFTKYIPPDLLQSRTTLIPKKDGASEPEDFRPITVSSVLVRTFHKVLATRMMHLVDLDFRQKAFRKMDGCAENTFLLDLAIKYHRRSFKHLYIASIDVAKAFDSVSHEALYAALEASGLPSGFLEYIRFMYENSSTVLSFDRQTSTVIHPTCGVKQGDPMSPMIFNCIINHLINKIPDEIGVQIQGGPKLNILAFADDIVLMASTPAGLQKLIDQCHQYLVECGLKINVGKSLTMSLKNVPHEKRSVVDPKQTFTCGNAVIKALKRTDKWRYLGVTFTSEGRVCLDVKEKLAEQLAKLRKAPLKPQQRLFGLRTTLLPSTYHQLVLGDTRISMLNKTDKIIRKSVKEWLTLPNDVPSAYIHAAVRDGGLGIPSLRWSIPRMRLARLENLGSYESCEFLKREKEISMLRVKDNSTYLKTPEELQERWARILHTTTDGQALKLSSKTPNQHGWVGEGTKFLKGKDFIELAKLRINALPVRSRTTRGRRKERLCRAGCLNPETLNHVLQNCHRTHDIRIKRHNAITSYLTRNLRKQEFDVFEEPHLRVNDELRKPDLVAVRGVSAFVIDAQVVSEHADLERAHQEKIRRYQPLEPVIKEEYKVRQVTFTSATLTWRGIWSPTSCRKLVELGFLKRKEIKVISTRVLVGGIMGWKIFNKRTTSRRQGIG